MVRKQDKYAAGSVASGLTSSSLRPSDATSGASDSISGAASPPKCSVLGAGGRSVGAAACGVGVVARAWFDFRVLSEGRGSSRCGSSTLMILAKGE